VLVLGSLNDRTLINPIRIAADDSLILAFDDGDRALKAFSLQGALLWSFGREGAGPGEFRKVRDISIGIDGDVLVVDQSNRRLTVVDRSGRLKREVSLRALGGSPEQILQISPVEYVVWALSPQDPPVVQLDTVGRLVRRRAAPFGIASKIPFLGLQPQLGNDPAMPGRWAYALIFADRWRVFDGLEPQSADRAMIEPIPLPEVEFEDHGRLGFSSRMGVAYRAARSIAVVGDTVVVLYGGRTREQGRWIDRYRLSTGAYVGSLLLPSVATEVAVSRGQLVVLEREEVPRIVLFRYRTAARDGGQ
jgi:6-bladed beta-propeller